MQQVIIAALIALSLAGHFQATNSDWRPLVVWTSALVTAVLFFASIVVHELSHAYAVFPSDPSPCSRSAGSPR